MLTKNKVKFINSLQKKKVRDDYQLYIIEGDKLVKEFLMADIPVRTLIAKPEFINALSPDLLKHTDEIEQASYDELKQISTLKTPHNALAVVPIPETKTDPDKILKDLCVALDLIQDPGNLGTIIRAAAWFGIRNIICSLDCVDVYNPKVILASMGAIIHVNVHYSDLNGFLKIGSEKGIPIYGTLLEGNPIYNQKLSNKGIILFGNESKGISKDLLPFITERIMIPKFSSATYGIESLNVSMAASVIFSEFARRKESSIQ